MVDFLSRVFDTSDFPPRWDCGNWSPTEGWLHILSDLGIWSAYVAIPIVLGLFVLRRRDIPFRGIFWLFSAFILACGATHLMEAIIFWWPAYRLAGVIKLFTAVVSWATVIALVPVIPKGLAMRSPDELEREVAARQEAERALQQANAELRRHVEELRASEERFRLLVDGTRDYAIFMLDPAGRVASWNRGAERIKQYRAEEIIGQHFSRFYAPEDVQAGKPEHGLLVAADEGRYQDEGWRVRKDGSRFWADVVITALRDEGGNLRGFSKITRDVTERKQAEENARRLLEDEAARRAAETHSAAIWEERERLRVTLHSIGDAVIATDVEGRVTLLNPVAEALTGWKSEEAIGRPLPTVFRIINETTRQEVENPVNKVLREGMIAGLANHTILISRESVERPIDDCAAPIRNERDELIGVVLVFRDVTENRAAERAMLMSEERLRASELRWRTMAEALPNLVWTDLPDGQCDWLSSQWEKYTGIPESDLLGLRWLETVIHPDDRDRTLACWTAACADQGDYDLEYRIRRHDGEYHWFKTRGVPIRDDQGRIVYWFGTCTDIEDVKRMEAALREADRRKNEFLATLAHELRNPLAPLRTGLQVLRMSEDRAEQVQARAMMERQLAQMIRLIDDLLDISRITSNKLELRKARIALTSVIENAVETARPLIDSKGQTLSIQLPREPVYLNADLTRLAQVFWNLLNNSAKYTDPRGRIELIARTEGDELVVGVRDNGIGIPPESLSGLFTMFSQVDHSLVRAQGGLGIGLALVKGLVEMHGGRVEARSGGIGRGSEFIVRLPVAREDSVDGAPRIERDAPSSSRLRILIVDDNRDGAASLGMMLSLQGHDSRTAHDGLEALRLAAAFRPELILLDIGLPNLNGYDVCRRIRQEPWGREIYIVAVTGWGQEDDRRRSEEAGFDQHIVKPVDSTGLERLLARLSVPKV
jgi:PAS domain S-box-containing protein